jgi:hypothetical protein
MRNKLFYAYLPLVVLFILGGCKDDKEADLTWLTNPGEKMELTVSATDIELDRDRPNEVAVSFPKWCPCSFVSLQNGRVVPVMLCPKCVLLL